MQQPTSLGFHRDTYNYKYLSCNVGYKRIKEMVLEFKIENLKVAPSNIGLVDIEKEFYKNTKKENLY